MSKKSFSPLVTAILTADAANVAAFQKCKAAADEILSRRNDGEPAADAYKRLMALAKSTVLAEGGTVHGKNTWSDIAAWLLIGLEPKAEIETERKGADEKATVTIKPANECRTAREVKAAAKQIREQTGLADARATNAPAKKEAAPEPTRASFWDEAVVVLKDKTTRERLFDLLRASGYVVTAAKKAARATPTAKESGIVRTAKNAGILPAQPNA